MRVLKPILYTAFAGLVFTGCKSISNLPVPNGSDVAIIAVAKKAPLTEAQKNTWGHLDLVKDSIPGMSVDKAYDFLQGKKSVTVVVGVVDSGTDLGHEDLKDVAWVNEKEVAGNGIDDDKNGYVDDINGWNFLGDAYKENLESARILHNPSLESPEIVAEIQAAHDIKVGNAEKTKTRFEQMLSGVKGADENLARHFGKDDYSAIEVAAITTEDPSLLQSIAIAKQMFGFGLPSLSQAQEEIKKELDKSIALLNNEYTNYRIGDNPEDINDSPGYGNGNPGVSTKSEAHGTHVSGIIGASRNNGKGVNGVADNVKIMAVRSVPDGDEYDKDVALGLRYAVDNGAKVINTSFGKGYSPHKEWVYEAIQYAAKHDVLIINAAGNDGKDIDVERTYPNDSKDLITEVSDNVLTIGAMSSSYNENLPANFSNYGKKNVDIFAPGVQIYSTTPENEYKHFSGTSMAAPSAVGVAALVRSYYPKLTASQVKHILMNSGVKIDLEVIKPGSQSRENPKGELVPFADLSVTGRVVNAYNALQMADRMVNGKK
ncbi:MULTISPECIES: S8 family peptidase [unclassified Polaribacter]|uniref:S8 family peptidase n=1 Tax=unclassified Polaribacter TaxID=196858 RepID=UPI001C4F0BB6|nr:MULTISPECIES: S8 family peptidase [unclassified Polaribacter]QXP63974.1 S8 family serine peptidase [Polaribacter sp. HaHaR_3_91]QXP66474.1 S8 family serine peptidase [Polaribacter sp. AHE13PA]QXP71957.1 S8 family serine peptidase [Polaribacter sp. R2A056_3_33]